MKDKELRRAILCVSPADPNYNQWADPNVWWDIYMKSRPVENIFNEYLKKMSGPKYKPERVDILLAQKKFKFTPGHPLKDELYVLHPLDPEFYYPAKDYAYNHYQEKVRYFLKMLIDLGIKKIEARYVHGINSFGNISCKIKDEVKIGVEAKFNKKSEYQLYAEYEPKGEPREPVNNIWLEHEQSWQSLLEQRLQGGLKNIKFEFAYNVNSGLSVDLICLIDSISVATGGKLNKEFETMWELNLSF
jgi:hypothetical protein